MLNKTDYLEMMMKLLAIDSSILEKHSVSRQLMAQYLNCWQQNYPNFEIIYRDLNQQPVNHLSSEVLNAKQQPYDLLSASLKSELEYSELLITEFLEAQEVVISAPMYNFTIPTQLKAWIDRILAAGRTFKYTEQGVIGLAGDKKVTIISTRGNHYSSNETMQMKDHQESYLKTVFAFIGINQTSVIRAESLHLSESLKENAIAFAEQEIKAHFLHREQVSLR
ncbi:MAG: FMN-dependent NADH-azoreductase [Legionella sp.]|uniref:FMN-dependent NADH-azoreductase n=1 Tax=Legionella sp. TaxID=459 RepID=UPI0039E428D5